MLSAVIILIVIAAFLTYRFQWVNEVTVGLAILMLLFANYLVITGSVEGTGPYFAFLIATFMVLSLGPYMAILFIVFISRVSNLLPFIRFFICLCLSAISYAQNYSGTNGFIIYDLRF